MQFSLVTDPHRVHTQLLVAMIELRAVFGGDRTAHCLFLLTTGNHGNKEANQVLVSGADDLFLLDRLCLRFLRF